MGPGVVAVALSSRLTRTMARVSGVVPAVPMPSVVRVTVSSTWVAGPPFENEETPLTVRTFCVVTTSPFLSSDESVRMIRRLPVAFVMFASAEPSAVVSTSQTW